MKYGKRIAALALALLFTAPLAACVQDDPSSGGNTVMGEKVSQIEKDGLSGLTTGNITVSLDGAGSLRITGAEGEVTSKQGAGNFTLYMDLTTDEVFDTRLEFRELTRLSSSEGTRGEVRFTDVDGGKRMETSFVFSLQEGNVTVRQQIELRDYASEAEITYSIENGCTGSTVVALVAGQLGGLRAEEDYTLFWPLHEGYLVPGAVAAAQAGTFSVGREDSAWRDENVKNVVYSYPAPLSMALVQAYNDEQGVYLYAKDDANEIKRFNFGVFDDASANEYDAEKTGSCSLSMTQYPYVAAGKSKTTYPLVIGVSGGGWYDGSDSYRAFKLTQDIRSKQYTQKVLDCSAIFSDTACQPNMQPKLCYDLTGSVKGFTMDLASQAAWVDDMGIDDMISIGWNDNGFDTMYPDYTFMPEMGTEADFRSGVQKLHENGDHLLPYLNSWAILQESNWYQSGAGDRCTVKTRVFDGTNYDTGSYYTWGKFIGVCPYADEYVQQFTAAADRLAKNGADGLWIDQLMEMPAEFCFDKSHGHENPATAYGQGIEKLMTSVRQTFEKYTDDFYFVCEGLNDAYIKYVDIPGNMWGRALTFSENCAPEITRYTIPSKILGLWNKDDMMQSRNEHAIACYLGDPLLMQGGSKNPYSRAYIELYERCPDIFGQGRFFGDKGVKGLQEGVKVGIRAGKDRFVLTAYNLTEKDAQLSLTVDLPALGYSGREIARISNATDRAQYYAFSGGSFSMDVGQNSIKTYLIELK